MADWTQSDHTFIAHTHYVNATHYVVTGAGDDVQSYDGGTIYICHAPTEDATVNDPGVTYEIQINTDATSGQTESWVTIAILTAGTAASTMETLDDSAASAQKVVPVAATGDLTIGDWVYIMDDGGAAGSEWAKVAEIAAAVSFTVVDNLTNSFTNGEDVFVEGVAVWAINVDLKGVAGLRVLITNGDATGGNWASWVFAKYGTAYE